MSERESKLLLLEVFHQLRRSGFALGIGELLAAFRAIDANWGGLRPEAMHQVARLLWCHSPQESLEFEEIYNAVRVASTQPTTPTTSSKLKTDIPPTPPEEPSVEPPPPRLLPTESPEQRAGLMALPVQTPFTPSAGEAGAELRAYWPVSRRFMVYTWRYLRRPVKDGPRVMLNVEATVEQTARQGFFLHCIYDRRESNDAHLILMIDQDGSMVPFHRFTRDLIDTACEESTIRHVDVIYFHNVPPPIVFRDPNLTEPLPLEQILAGCSPESSVLLVSDAGAARGFRSMTRIRATTEFVARLKRVTTLIAWLNPMPKPRWRSTSAQFIARLVPMFQMNNDGFSNAVDVLRGQPLHPHR